MISISLILVLLLTGLVINYTNTTQVQQLCGQMMFGDDWEYGYIVELAKHCG
jgi:hypothetical protein